MRKLSLLAGAVMALAVASSAFAAAPTTMPASAHHTTATPTPAAHHWTATLAQTQPAPGTTATLHGRARLFLAAGGKAGWVQVQLWGAARGDTVTVTVADTTAGTILGAHRKVTVRAHNGRIAFLIRLSPDGRAALKTAVASTGLTITVTATTNPIPAVSTVATGTFKATQH